jgi:alpha-methylacyl-CoA racemase
MSEKKSGPLRGLKVLEIVALGPAPFASMLLADMGAEVLRIERKNSLPSSYPSWDLLDRGKTSLRVELKRPAGVTAVLRMVEQADVLIEGFRPGVMERLGLGPDVCLARNPRLIYGRMTGFGQTGPLAQAAGHDINYIALSGALEPLGRAGNKPTPPLNLLGDFGGGAMFLVAGVLAALFERSQSQRGQVVDAAMVDGSALLCTMLFAFKQSGMWSGGRGGNLVDTGAPFYDVYETRDGKYVSVGALEPQFYRELVTRLGFAEDARFAAQLDARSWPAMREGLRERFLEKTRAEWVSLLQGTDTCFAPVLSPDEAHAHAHNAARDVFVEHAGARVPGAAPRFSRTPASLGAAPTPASLHAWGFAEADVEALREAGAIA